jgi:hypothetical protein
MIKETGRQCCEMRTSSISGVRGLIVDSRSLVQIESSCCRTVPCAVDCSRPLELRVGSRRCGCKVHMCSAADCSVLCPCPCSPLSPLRAVGSYMYSVTVYERVGGSAGTHCYFVHVAPLSTVCSKGAPQVWETCRDAVRKLRENLNEWHCLLHCTVSPRPLSSSVITRLHSSWYHALKPRLTYNAAFTAPSLSETPLIAAIVPLPLPSAPDHLTCDSTSRPLLPLPELPLLQLPSAQSASTLLGTAPNAVQTAARGQRAELLCPLL